MRFSDNLSSVAPEPSSLLLLGTGLIKVLGITPVLRAVLQRQPVSIERRHCGRKWLLSVSSPGKIGWSAEFSRGSTKIEECDSKAIETVARQATGMRPKC